MDSQDSFGKPSGGYSGGKEDDEAIRLYRDNRDEVEDVRPTPRGPGASASEGKADGSKSKEKKYSGSIFGSENESRYLAVEPVQKRFDNLEGDRREALNQRVEDENRYRNILGHVLLVLVCTQIFTGDLALWVFMWRNPHNQTIVMAWLSSCVVEVIGVIVVITKSVYPTENRYRDALAGEMNRPGVMSQVSEVKTSQTIENSDK